MPTDRYLLGSGMLTIQFDNGSSLAVRCPSATLEVTQEMVDHYTMGRGVDRQIVLSETMRLDAEVDRGTLQWPASGEEVSVPRIREISSEELLPEITEEVTEEGQQVRMIRFRRRGQKE